MTETGRKISEALTKYFSEKRNCKFCGTEFFVKSNSKKSVCTRSCSASHTKNKLGHKSTEETKEKLRISHTGHIIPLDVRLKMSSSHKGKIFSDEHKKNISKNRRYSERSNIYSSNAEIKFGEEVRKTFKIDLKNSFWLFNPDRNKRFCYDYKVPGKKILIECDGTYWHSLPGRKEYDLQKDQFAKALGFEVIRFPLDYAHQAEALVKREYDTLKGILS